MLVRLPGGSGRLQGDAPPETMATISGEPAVLAETLRSLAREGIAHVQLVLDPITLYGIRAIAPVLVELDRGS